MESILYYLAWKVVGRMTWYLICYFWHYFCFKKFSPIFKLKKESTFGGTEQYSNDGTVCRYADGGICDRWTCWMHIATLINGKVFYVCCVPVAVNFVIMHIELHNLWLILYVGFKEIFPVDQSELWTLLSLFVFLSCCKQIQMPCC